jgi:hypothetical protein
MIGHNQALNKDPTEDEWPKHFLRVRSSLPVVGSIAVKMGAIMYRFLVLGVALLGLAACATIIDGTTQEVSFQSNPEDVTVTVLRTVSDSNSNDVWREKRRILGKTPLALQLDREENQKVIFEKIGYKPLTMNLATTLNGKFWGNILIGGVLGPTTDSVSGASREYSPRQYFVTLVSD